MRFLLTILLITGCIFNVSAFNIKSLFKKKRSIKLVLPPPPPTFKTNYLKSRVINQPETLQEISVALPLITKEGVSITNILKTKGTVVISWQGGNPPFQVQDSDSFNGPWTEIAWTTNQTITFPSAYSQRFFRIKSGRNPAKLIIVNDNSYTKFSAWKDTIRVSTITFPTNCCEMQEGCIGDCGPRKLLQFTVTLANIGDENLILPTIEQNTNLFYYSPCHKHWHLVNFSKFELKNSSNETIVVRSQKEGWCLKSNNPITSPASINLSNFDCTHPGLDYGWSDTYGYLSCMWIDITNVINGDYNLTVTIDPNNVWGINTFVTQNIHIENNIISLL